MSNKSKGNRKLQELEKVVGRKYDPNMVVEPVVIKKGAAKDVEQEVLFILEDDETNEQTEYFIPKTVRPNLAIKYLNNLRNEGGEYAMAVAMADLLGDETMNVMAESEDIGEDEMEQIMVIVTNKMLGAMEKMQGNS